MSYDSGYPNEPIGDGNPYYRCVHCQISDPQINGEINNHAVWCAYRVQKQGYTVTDADYYDMLEECDRDELQIYTSVVIAKRALEKSDIVKALAHLRIDADKLCMVSPVLYKIVMKQS